MTRLRSICVLALGLLALPAAAQDTTISYTGALGIEAHRQRYREPSLDVTEKGWFGGLTAEGTAELRLWQLRGDVRLAYGQMEYSGSGTADGIDDAAFEGRILLARAIPIGDGRHRVTPYFGYGYRRLMDYLGGHITSTGAAGYDRLSQYHYMPVGVEGTFRLGAGWSVKPTVEYDQLLEGSQDSYLSQAVAGLGDLHNTQESGWGLRASIMLQTTAWQRPIEFGPFVRYWNIEDSDVQPVTFRGLTVGGGFEPANETIEAGAALKLRF